MNHIRRSASALASVPLIAAAVLTALVATPAGAATSVAVFNFQMKSDTPEWRWLEKGIADRVTTDFVQDRGLAVVARDEMQLLAERMKWVPEMATTDLARMQEVRRTFAVAGTPPLQYLATGVYAVEGEQIVITGQIIEVESRNELARKEVRGKAADVLELQRRLSAELLAWFSKKKPEDVLTQLPVWTRSLPAARALYEGMDLYDQGRYAEGWLKFRQASRLDEGYVEAQYWVGKMYYFLNRYEHARRGLERFVYLAPAHPRIGDAINEYLRTYESTGAPAQSLLDMYAYLGHRFPYVPAPEIYSWLARPDDRRLETWLKARTILLLEQVGRYREAVLAAGMIYMDNGFPFDALHPTNSRAVGLLASYVMSTGATLEPGPLTQEDWTGQAGDNLLRFTAAGGTLTQKYPPARYVVYYGSVLLAPPGYVFKTLRFDPMIDSDKGAMDISLRPCWEPEMGPLSEEFRTVPTRSAMLFDARAGGVTFNRLPRANPLIAKVSFRATRPADGGAQTPGADGQPPSGVVTVHNLIYSGLMPQGMRVAATLEKVAPAGALDIACQDTSSFGVDVDGRFERIMAGMVGPLPAGEHTVRLYPLKPGTPYVESTVKATVVPGKVAPLLGRMPWAKDSPWAGWRTSLLAREYPDYDLRVNKDVAAPAVLAEVDAIRVVWARAGDLWSSTSTDGDNYSVPAKLDLPVSSAWLETSPRLLRDEVGRFVLLFASDRDAQHHLLLYSTWSRDFVHWSAPALVIDKPLVSYDAVADDRGRVVVAHRSESKVVRILASRDASRWDELGRLNVNDCATVNLLRRADGRLELYTVDVFGRTMSRRFSGDAVSWGQPEPVYTNTEHAYALVRDDSRVLMLMAKKENLPTDEMRLIAEKSGGGWQKSGLFTGMPLVIPSMAFHPRWGYLVAWMTPSNVPFISYTAGGPYVMRGPSLEPLLAPGQPVQASPVQK